MHAAEAADTITETAEEKAHEARERFRGRAALLIAVIAAILAVCELGGENAKNAMIYNNIKASDTWAFYQAKNERQAAFKLASDELKRALAAPNVAPASRAAIEADLGRYGETIDRYENEPDPAAPNNPARGEGKKQLSAKAKAFEEARELASERNESFDYAQMLLQLAIVLGSVAILSMSRLMLLVSGALGAGGAALLANGFLLLAHLPG